MRVRLVRRPGQHGTKAFVEQYGERLICVRYRYDDTARRRYKTVELIVEQKEWVPKDSTFRRDTMVGVRLKTSDKDSYAQLLTMPEQWDPELGVWHLRYEQVIALGLTDRIIGTVAKLRAAKASKARHRAPQ